MMVPSSKKDWVDRLAQALAVVAEVQRDYQNELNERCRQRERVGRESLERFPVWDPSRDLHYFYDLACNEEGTYFEQRYHRLRPALHDAESILGEHPALAEILNPDKRREEFRVRLLNLGQRTSRLALVAGLMCRAEQIREDGFRVASCELNTLLDLSLDDAEGPVAGNLNVGYHVSVFYGLRFSEQVELEDGMLIVPLEQTEAFLNRNVLRNIAPSIVMNNEWKSVGVIVKRFLWKPMLLSLDDETEPELDWGRSFFDDTETFIELLAVSHGVPVVKLMSIPLCTDRTASLLLGEPHYHSSTDSKSWVRSFGGLTRSHQLDSDALDQTKKAFDKRKSELYQKYSPVVSRLAEALARKGRFAADDKILDVAIALERIYEPDNPEVNFKLKSRGACFLEADTEGRKRVFKEIGKFYDARSAIVHRRKEKKKKRADRKKEMFDTGFKLARRSLVKLLDEGSPTNWDEVVLEVMESH